LKYNPKLLKANNALVKGLTLEQQQHDDNNDEERSSPYFQQLEHPPSSSPYWHQLAEAKTLSKICRLFPFLAMKVVRLRLSLVNDLFTAPRSEIKQSSLFIEISFLNLFLLSFVNSLSFQA
jgi:hypothetical protein